MHRNVIGCVSQEAADREESVAASASAAGALKAELEALQVCAFVGIVIAIILYENIACMYAGYVGVF